MYRACIFDLDGTLANTLASIAGFANAALNGMGLSPLPVSRYRELVGNGADVLVRGMLRESGGRQEDFARLRKAYDSLYEANPMALVENYPGVPALVERLCAAGVPLAVLSNKPDNVTRMVVEALYGGGLFAVCHGQREGIERKPHPAGALLCAAELNVSPENCLYIGDTDVDIKTAAAAGMDSCGVLWGFRGREELAANRAHYIVENPAEIYNIVFGGEAWKN